jgi:hypothetical protein
MLFLLLPFLTSTFPPSGAVFRAARSGQGRVLCGAANPCGRAPLGHTSARREGGPTCAGWFSPIQHCSPKVFVFSRYHCRHPSIRTLDERFIRSVQVGCSRFSRCCHLIFDLSFHLDDGVGPGVRRSHRNSALKLWASCLVFSSPWIETWIETTPRPATRLLAGCAVVRKLLH